MVGVLLIGGGLGWFVLTREAEPVRLRLALEEGQSHVYRIESTSETGVDIRGLGRKLSTQMEGLLKLDVRKVKGAVARVQGDLTVFSFSAQGSVVPELRRVRGRMRIHRAGQVYGGLIGTADGLPVLMLPALSPLLPETPMRPGDTHRTDGVRLFARKDPLVEGTTRFVRYEEVQGVQLAVLEGSFTTHVEKDRALGTGELRVDMQARIDPSTGTVHDAEGTVHIDVVGGRGMGDAFTSTQTFRLLPPNG